MRECASEADLIKEENSEYLQFTTERRSSNNLIKAINNYLKKRRHFKIKIFLIS